MRLLAELRAVSRNIFIAKADVVNAVTPEMERVSTLAVEFYTTKDIHSWQAPEAPGQWNPFLKWYHGRPQSAAFVMQHSTGSRMFKRCDIRSYSITNSERKKSPSAQGKVGSE